MLGLFRGFLNTWAARAFFFLLIASFVLWGVNDVVRNAGGPGSDAAVVGSERVTAQQLDDAYRNQLAQLARMTDNRTMDASEKARIARLTLEQLVQDALVVSQARAMGVAAPDAAVREAVYAIPAFRGPDGRFNRPALQAWLQGNGMTENRMLGIVRQGLLRDQLLNPLRAGLVAPEALIRPAFAYQGQTRVAALVAFPFDAVPEPAAPTDAQLHEMYEDNPGAYSAPSYRRVRAVILSADTIARGIDVSEADIAAAYEAGRSRFVQGEKRAADLLIAPDEATAAKLEAAWKGGATWEALDRDATAAGATAIRLPDSSPDEFPSPEVAKAVFAATPDAVTGPVPAAGGGSMVLRVTHVTPARNQTLADAHDEIRDAIAHERAVQALPERKDQLQIELSGVSRLEDLPAGLGVAPVVGTLDAQGNTPEGEPAPIPGSPAVRQAIVAAAFAATKDALPVLQDGPDGTSFALTVEDTSAPKLKPFDDVRAQLEDDYVAAARRHVQDTAATKLLVAAQKGNLDDAATVAGLRVTRTPPLRRDGPAPGDVPSQLIQPLFSLKKNEPTMIETPDAFYVAAPVEITDPEPSTDPAAAARLRTALNKSLADDLEITYVNALRSRVQPTVNTRLLQDLSR